jgi:hypothetical protein
MSTVKEITSAIQRLPRKDFFRLHKWVHRRFEDEWDKEIAEDARAGRLDKLAAEALAEHRAGRTTPFPPDEKQRHA